MFIKKPIGRCCSFANNKLMRHSFRHVRYNSSSMSNLSSEISSLAAHAFSNLLQPLHNDIINQQKILLQETKSLIRSIDSSSGDIETVQDITNSLHDIFMIAIVGEYNSGKSTLINSLLGGQYLGT